jgi:predicted phosphate transport protein (TIGR00153 family)
MGLKSLFKRKQDRFYLLLTQQAEKTLHGMDALLEYVKDPTEEKAATVDVLEGEADEVRRILIDELNRTFITPFDREDIFALSRTIDDVLDYGQTTVEEMTTLGVAPNEYIRSMATVLRDAAKKLHLAMLRLKDHPQVALDHATRAKALENQAERIYREAIADLFRGPQDIEHVVLMLKMREVYRHLSNAADRGDEAANILSDIVVKTT